MGFKKWDAGSQCGALGSQGATVDMGRMMPVGAFWETIRTGKVREGMEAQVFKSPQRSF